MLHSSARLIVTSMPSSSASSLSLPAFRADQFRVESGANMGDNLGVLDDLVLDDIYELRAGSVARRLGVLPNNPPASGKPTLVN